MNPAEFQAPAQQAGFHQTIYHPITAPQNFENFFVSNPQNYVQSQKQKKPKESSEVDDLNEYQEEYNYNSDDDEEEGDDKKEKYTNVDYKHKKPVKLTYAPSKYAPGKIAYSSQVKNFSPQPFASNKQSNIQPTLTPYQKYSFQPVANLKSASFENVQSTPLPYKAPYVAPSKIPEYAQPTNSQPQKLKGNCRKVEKQLSKEDLSHGRFRRGADEMACFVCDDPKTGGSYEQCSYTSDPNNAEYFTGHASKYSTQSYDPDSYRAKRSPKDRRDRRNKRQKEEAEEDEEVEPYKNPYDEEKSSSHSFSSKPEEFDSDNYYKAPDFSNFKEDYRFGPEYFTDSTNEEKSYSEKEAEEIKKNPENCKKVKKESLTCMVCKNPKTGGNYEQCSYSSEPQEKRYAYVKEKKYNSNDPEETKEEESTENKPVRQNIRRQRPQKKYQENYEAYNPAPTQQRQRKVKNQNANGYEVFHPSSSNKKETKENKYVGLNPELYGSFEKEEDQDKRYAENVYRLFPEYAEKESQIKEAKRKPGYEYQSDLPEYFSAEESKKDVDSVLAEFAKKDRSNCKKIAKDKMTCYICTDDKGVNHEECMFVSESQPKSSHLAYHEVKEFSTDPKKSETNPEVVKVNPDANTSASSKRRKYQKEVETTSEEKQPEATNVASIKTPRIARRRTNISKDLVEPEKVIQKRETKSDETTKKGVKEQRTDEGFDEVKDVQTENSDGAYASELVPKYSKKLGTTLPAYMLEISEHEKEFDEIVASGR